MLARLDKPLRLTGAAKTAKAQLGRIIGAIAAEGEPWLRAFNARRQSVACCNDWRTLMATARENTMRPLLAVSSAIDRAIGLKPKGHDFIIDRRHNRPSVSRHMSVTGG